MNTGTPTKERGDYKIKILLSELLEAAERRDTKAVYSIIDKIRAIKVTTKGTKRKLTLEQAREQLKRASQEYNETLDFKRADELEKIISSLTGRITRLQKQAKENGLSATVINIKK